MVIQSQAGSELCGHQPILCRHTHCSLLARCRQVVGQEVGTSPRLVVWFSGTGSAAPGSWHRVEGAGWKPGLGYPDRQELCHTPHEGVGSGTWYVVLGSY